QNNVDNINTKKPKINESDSTLIKSLSLKTNITIDQSKIKKSDSVPAVDFKINNPEITVNTMVKPKHKKTAMDRTMNTARIVTNTVAMIGNVVVIPATVVQNASKVTSFSRATAVSSLIRMSSSLPGSVQEKLFLGVTKSASGIARATETVGNVAVRLNHQPTSSFIQNKVLPVVNLAISGVSVYQNVRKFEDSYEDDNKKEMAKAGTQVVLNTVSGVTGMMKGKMLVVSAVTGFATLASDKVIDVGFYFYGKVKK
ncbi:MAG: hypothetical protein H7263_09355, partial [Candidatus Sericytochromatia bacterium]|nr:hypothetical protein [Candidatus Sericytochromatia bacterium]